MFAGQCAGKMFYFIFDDKTKIPNFPCIIIRTFIVTEVRRNYLIISSKISGVKKIIENILFILIYF